MQYSGVLDGAEQQYETSRKHPCGIRGFQSEQTSSTTAVQGVLERAGQQYARIKKLGATVHKVIE
jgi:hypothetical protein